MYELIIFDADGTLLDFEAAEEKAFAETFKDIIHLSAIHELNSTYLRINKALWEAFERGEITPNDLKIERFRRLCKEASIDVDPMVLSQLFLKVLSEQQQLIVGAVEILELLKNKYRLALITNGLIEVQNGRLYGNPITRFFEHIVISEEIGVNKPDPRIFEYTLEKMNHFDKKTTLMVGDSLTSDILGGINSGIDTCWINFSGNDCVNEIIPTYTIHELNELERILR
jgi:putative hydrolase of the HAD superfamily